jgi:DNA repair protein SbcC/Rad50
MIIRTLKLAPFAGFANHAQSFKPGLNVILGPNEAGKSTLVNALFAALFVLPEVKKNSDDWRSLIQKCLPHPGGDTARVEITFETYGRTLSYSCAWGEDRGARLKLQDGSEINAPEVIREQLQQALRFGRSTYQEVLFARQEEMLLTLKRLKENREAATTISDLLRSSIFEAGGVSLEALDQAIEKEEEALLSNWNSAADIPREGRGIDNRHKTKIGKILSAHYEYERVQRQLREARAAEEEVDELNHRLKTTADILREHLVQLIEMEKLEGDVHKRNRLEPTLDNYQLQEKELVGVVSEWPRVEESIRNIKEKAETASRNIADLEKELQAAEMVIAARQKRALLERARPLQDELSTKEKEFLSLPPLDNAQLGALEEKLQQISKKKAVLEAMKLTATLRTSSPLQLTVTAGLEEPRVLTHAGEIALEADGRLLIKSTDWSLEVQAGEGDAALLLDQLHHTQISIEADLADLQLKNISEARSLHALRRDLENALGTIHGRLNDLLNGQPLSELEAAIKELGPDQPVRSPEKIREEISEIKIKNGAEQVTLSQEEKKLKAWIEKYESSTSAINSLAELKSHSREIEKELSNLAPLPAEYASTGQFIAELKNKREQNSDLQEELSAIREKLAHARSRLPEETTEDLEEALHLKESELVQLKGRGVAISLVRSEFNELRAEMDKDTLAPLTKLFLHNLAVVTNNRYSAAMMEGAIPGEITAAEGKKVPVDLLSTGTSGSVALALRLAMASYLLSDAKGFMVMDDPLINLDPTRKEAAAELVREFAREKQAIVTTCDPETAKLLGGNVMEV